MFRGREAGPSTEISGYRPLAALEALFVQAEQQACSGEDAGQSKAMTLLSEVLHAPRCAVRNEAAVESGSSVEQRHNTLLIKSYLLRARTLLAIAHNVRSTGAQEQDTQPMFRPDHVTLSQLAYQDTEVIRTQLDPQCQDAVMLQLEAAQLGEPHRVRECVLRALSHNPTDERLVTLSREYTERRLHASSPSADGGSVSTAPSELECPLCFHLFIEPVTAQCGHTFCRRCLNQALEYNSTSAGDPRLVSGGSRRQACPLCRTSLHMDIISAPTTKVIERIIESQFPNEIALLKAEQAKHGVSSTTGEDGGRAEAGSTCREVIPLFNVGLLVPGWTYHFRVFEPRYRLMFRRVLAGSRVFGSLDHKEMNDWHQGDMQKKDLLGVTLKVLDVGQVPDGSFQLSCEALHRFRVTSLHEQDGYHVAVGSRYDDDASSPEVVATCFERWASLVESHQEAKKKKAEHWLGRLIPTSADEVVFPQVVDPKLVPGSGSTSSSVEAASLWAIRALLPTAQAQRDALYQRNTLSRLDALHNQVNTPSNAIAADKPRKDE